MLSSVHPANAQPKEEVAKVTTAAQAANIARLHYINGRRGVVFTGKPETIRNWKKPTVTRSKSKQKNLLWNVNFLLPFPNSTNAPGDFTITVAENGKVVKVVNNNWFN